ncbi:MAG TPA: NUDIX hydrolase, partial [Kineosporiaceae bacterium]|nr:NUDIX hydrolase [Kineosporiaceae bacterium]
SDGGWLADVPAPRPVVLAEAVHEGIVWDVVRDTVDLGPGGVVRREYIRHTGAVAVLAMDDDGRVAVIHQYRHPVRRELWELPAGLLDVDGEPPLEAARRELMEEADLRAQRWDVLVDWFNSPGGSDEALRVYLARDLSAVPEQERHVREAEEHGMPVAWATLDEIRDAVLSGRVHNPSLVVGGLAAWAAREAGWSTLRPADTPWHFLRG